MTRPGARQLSHPFVVVALIVASSPHDEYWAHPIALRGRLTRDTTSRILQRMLDDGWLIDRRAPTRRGRPRRMYTTTPKGIAALHRICTFADGNTRYQKWMPQHVPDMPAALPGHDAALDALFDQTERPPLPRGRCPECGKDRPLRGDDTLQAHGGVERGSRCTGSWMYPNIEQPDPRPVEVTT